MISAARNGSRKSIEKSDAHTQRHSHTGSQPSTRSYRTPVSRKIFFLRTFSMMYFHVSAYTTFYCMRDRRVAKSLIALFLDDGLIFISHLTVVPFRAKALGLECHHSSDQCAVHPPRIFLSVCVRKRTRRDLHVVEYVNVNHSCENLEKDSIIQYSVITLVDPIKRMNERLIAVAKVTEQSLLAG